MMANCIYAREVWRKVESWSEQAGITANQSVANIKGWWNDLVLQQGQTPNCQRTTIVYTAWNLWKKDADACLTTSHVQCSSFWALFEACLE
jgi:hypothetical protein